MKGKVIMRRVIMAALILSMCLALVCGCQSTTKAERLMAKGDKYLLDGKYEEALLQYEMAFEIEPNNSVLYLKAAQSLQDAGKTADAVHLLCRGAERFPGNAGIIEQLSDKKTALGELVEWRSAISEFLYVDMPERALIDPWEMDEFYLAGFRYALADVNFDGVPELFSLHRVGNAAGDTELHVYSIENNSIHEIANLRYFDGFQNELAGTYGMHWRAIYDSLNTGEAYGISVYKNKETGNLVYINIGTTGGMADYHYEVTELGSLETEKPYAKTRFAVEGSFVYEDMSSFPPETEIDREGGYYHIYYCDGKPVSKAEYEQNIAVYFAQFEPVSYPVQWAASSRGWSDDPAIESGFIYLAEPERVARATETLINSFKPFISKYDAPVNADVAVDMDGIRLIAAVAQGLPSFENAAQLSKHDMMGAFTVAYWNNGLRAINGRDTDYGYSFAADEAQRFITGVLGIEIPDLTADFYYEAYGTDDGEHRLPAEVACENGIYTVYSCDYNAEPMVLDCYGIEDGKIQVKFYEVSLYDDVFGWTGEQPVISMTLEECDSVYGYRIVSLAK